MSRKEKPFLEFSEIMRSAYRLANSIVGDGENKITTVGIELSICAPLNNYDEEILSALCEKARMEAKIEYLRETGCF